MTDWQIAIETSGRSGSVALLSADQVVLSHDLDAQQRTAAVLASALRPLLKHIEQQNAALGFVSVTNGPGSFTGLRIGVTTAKTLAYALQTPVVPLDTLAVMAHQAFAEDAATSEVVVGLNAYRGQVFVRRETRRQPSTPSSEVWSSEQWKSFVHDISEGVVVAGNAGFASETQPSRPHANGRSMPTAAGLGRLAWQRFQQGETVDPMRLSPQYLRPSAAEEKADRSRAVE